VLQSRGAFVSAPANVLGHVDPLSGGRS
jgi:hypothetical protein